MTLPRRHKILIAKAGFPYTIACVGSYVGIPNVPIYLQNAGTDPFIIGLFFSLALIVSVSLSFISVRVRRGRRYSNLALLSAATVASIASNSILLLTPHTISIVAASILVGVSGFLWGPTYRALLAFMDAKFLGGKGAIFKFLYIIICTGALLGTGLVYLLPLQPRQFVLLSILFSVVTLALLPLLLKEESDDQREKIFTNGNGKVEFHKNWNLRLVVLTMLTISLSFLVFIQFESLFIITLKDHVSNPQRVFALLLFINSLLGLLIQSLSLRMKTSPWLLFAIGNLFFILAYLLFFSASSQWVLLVGVLVFTLGENCTVPTSDILISKMSEDKRFVFRIAQFKYLGQSMGTLLLGWILSSGGKGPYYGALILFLTLSGGIALYSFGKKKTANPELPSRADSSR